jgi:hypothetical protein
MDRSEKSDPMKVGFLKFETIRQLMLSAGVLEHLRIDREGDIGNNTATRTFIFFRRMGRESMETL